MLYGRKSDLAFAASHSDACAVNMLVTQADNFFSEY